MAHDDNYQDNDDNLAASSKMKAYAANSYSGKNLLPYNVTPPRHMGPTEAERKIEELTRQLEEEMEKQEEEGEYFGEFDILFICPSQGCLWLSETKESNREIGLVCTHDDCTVVFEFPGDKEIVL